MDITVIDLLQGHPHTHNNSDRNGCYIQYNERYGPNGNVRRRVIPEDGFFRFYSQPNAGGLNTNANLRTLKERRVFWDVLAQSKCTITPPNQQCVNLVRSQQPSARLVIEHTAKLTNLPQLRLDTMNLVVGTPRALLVSFEFDTPIHPNNFQLNLSLMFREVAFDVLAELLLLSDETTQRVLLRALVFASVANGYHRLAIGCCRELMRLQMDNLSDVINDCLSVYDRMIDDARSLRDFRRLGDLVRWRNRLNTALRRP